MFLVWLDLRTQSTVEHLLKKVPGRNKTFSKVGDIPEHLNGSCSNVLGMCLKFPKTKQVITSSLFLVCQIIRN